MDCSLVPPKEPHPQNLQKKTSAIDTKYRYSQKFSHSKVSHYTALLKPRRRLMYAQERSILYPPLQEDLELSSVAEPSSPYSKVLHQPKVLYLMADDFLIKDV